MLCGGVQSCADGQFCGKSNENPFYGSYNFDNVMFSMMQVFQTITLSGYTDNYVLLM